MSRFFDVYLSPNRVRNFQDVLYALLVLSVTTAFILFLLGSTDILTSLTIIGITLCLSLMGGVLRFFSMTRVDNELQDRQETIDQNMGLIQHRVNDHDLTLLKMAGQIETLETGLRAVRVTQHHAEKRQQEFMKGMKDRMLQLVTVLSRPRGPAPQQKSTKPATAAVSKKPFFPALPAINANMAPPQEQKETHRYDDDVYVSPALMRDAIDTAIKVRRIDSYIQPIVNLPQQKAMAFDVYGRIRLQPGVYIPARQYRGYAVHAGQQMSLDHLVLRDTATLARQMPNLPLFVNLTREGLTHRATLVLLADLMRDTPTLRSQLVISLSQKDLGHIDTRTETVIQQLADMGIKFALNDVQSADLDLNLLARLKFTYIKLAHNKLVTTRDSDGGAALVHRFLTRLQARGMTAIAAHVETRDQIRPLLDYPIPLAQGYAFGRPDRPVTYQKRVA